MSICRPSIAVLRRGSVLLGCWVAGGVLRSAAAQAPASFAGRWQADPMTVRWVIGEWGDACGPRPSGGGEPGVVVEIEVEADELVITGPSGTYSTERCWAMHPELDRQSHARGQRSWATTCRTKPNDARQEILQTTVTASGDVIHFRESGQYQFVLQGQTCSASSGRWRTYRRLSAAGEPVAPPPTAPTPDPIAPTPTAPVPELPQREFPGDAPRRPAAPAGACASPGPPARIEVRPARKLMRGGESFAFRATVQDAHGCALRTPVSWRLVPPDAPAKLEGGVLEIAAEAADTELRVVATAASQSVQAAVDVVSNERYVALLESGSFTADGDSIEAATATITSGSLGAQDAAIEAGPGERKWTFVVLVGGIALVFGLLGAYLLKRAQNRHRRRARPAVDPGTVVFAGEPPAAVPPGAGTATRLEPPAASAARAATVCPICGTLYPTRELESCPKDGAQLLPVNA